MFRGLLQEQLQRALRGGTVVPLSGANIVTSAVFTALHFLYHAPAWAAAVFVPSLIFGYFKDKTGRLGIPVALHVFYNSGYYWLFGAGTT
ncbi:MAG: JDVT-CTERM system CAAX-type protease [Pseudomonadota bacterium]|nr:MAG: JDVT-CTERM system CAAX-type protease [Pseudomonadota bacterium]